MCSRGVYQLRNVKLQFCDWGGSSTGVRDLLAKKDLDGFLEQNPSINFMALIRTGAHPCFHTEYINGWKCSIPLRNLTAEEILQMLLKARNQFGQKAIPHSGNKVISANRSIQGTWKPDMWGTTQTYEEEKLRQLPDYPFEVKVRKEPQNMKGTSREDKFMRKKIT